MTVKSLVMTAAILGGALPLPLFAEPMGDGDVLAGKRVYSETCVACHGPVGDGKVPGAPDFTAGERLNKDDATLLEHIAKGFRSPGSPLAMPPRGGNPALTEQDLVNTLAYIRKELHQR